MSRASATLGRASRQWLVLALLLALLTGCTTSDPPSPVGTLPPITAHGMQLRAGGRAFEVRGVNYIHPFNTAATRCAMLQFGADGNCPWDMPAIEADLDRLRSLGVNTVRVFLDYYVFGGARAADPNYSAAQPLAHLDSLIAAANSRGLYVLPVLLAKYPQDRFGADSYAMALELHVRPVVRHLAGRSGLLAWDLFNEPDLGSPVDMRCWDWDNADFPLCFTLAQERLRFIQMLHDEVKRLDPQRLTTVSLGFAKNYFEPTEADLKLAEIVDLYAYHYYDDDPYDSGRYRAHWYYGQGFPADLRRANTELTALQHDKPILITEIGFPTGNGATRDETTLRRDLQTALQAVRDDQTSGLILWPFQTEPEALVGNLYTE